MRREKGAALCKMWYLYLWWARCADNDNTLLEAPWARYLNILDMSNNKLT
jgi:hypothetical protein